MGAHLYVVLLPLLFAQGTQDPVLVSTVHFRMDEPACSDARRRQLGWACILWHSVRIRKYVSETCLPSETRSLIDLASPSSSHRIVQRTVVTIYFSANAYIIDAFPGYVASALAAKTVVRSGAGAAMPLFITAMYHNLGNGWAASTWAFVSLAMVRNTSSLNACVRY